MRSLSACGQGDLGVEPVLWKNNFEEYYANEGSGASWQELFSRRTL